MTERISEGPNTVLRFSGQIEAEHIQQLRSEEGLRNPSAGAQWNARCIQFNLSTLQYRTSKRKIHNVKTRTLYQCNRCSRTGQHKHCDSRSSWSGSTPGHLADREARTL